MKVDVCGIIGWFLFLGGFVQVRADQVAPGPRHAEVYQRAAVQFVDVNFFKPIETKSEDLTLKLAPLIIQEVKGGKQLSALDRFGTLSLSNGVAILDPSRPAIYVQSDTMQFNGRPHARFTYVWCYSAEPRRQPEAGLPLQGIRLTFNSAGEPAVWEVLADDSDVELIFVSQTLETAARTQFGKPLPGRHYVLERSLDDAPNVVVARVIDDGPMPLGPIVYLRAGTRSVSTLICRCMPAQAKTVLATSTYDLLSFPLASPNSLLTKAKAQAQGRTAFWPGDKQSEGRLEKCLRLPDKF